MATVSKSCSKCGNIFYYDDGLFATKPETEGGLFGGYICSNCANQRKIEEHWKEQEEQRKRQEISDGLYRMEQEERWQREENYRRQKDNDDYEREKIKRDIQYKRDNPGDYKCPNCSFFTLKKDEERCPKCNITIENSFWQEIQKRKFQHELNWKSDWEKQVVKKFLIFFSFISLATLFTCMLGWYSFLGFILGVISLILLYSIYEYDYRSPNGEKPFTRSFFMIFLTYVFSGIVIIIFTWQRTDIQNVGFLALIVPFLHGLIAIYVLISGLYNKFIKK